MAYPYPTEMMQDTAKWLEFLSGIPEESIHDRMRQVWSNTECSLGEFVEPHQQAVKEALKNKRVCPNCEEDDCHRKCSSCSSVAYCSKGCQVAHWPKHKKTCKVFKHVVSVMKEMDKDVGQKFLLAGISEVLATLLTLEGVEVKVTICIAYSPEVGEMYPYQLVIVDGRYYDVSNVLANQEAPGYLIRAIRPVPPVDELDPESLVYDFLGGMQARHILAPWECPTDIDANDFEMLRQHAFYKTITKHFIECNDRKTLYNLYGEKVFLKVFRETMAQFQKRIEEAWKKNKTEEKVEMALLMPHSLMFQLFLGTCKPETRERIVGLLCSAMGPI